MCPAQHDVTLGGVLHQFEKEEILKTQDTQGDCHESPARTFPVHASQFVLYRRVLRVPIGRDFDAVVLMAFKETRRLFDPEIMERVKKIIYYSGNTMLLVEGRGDVERLF